MPRPEAWRKANPDWRKGRTPDQMKAWELKTKPEFYWDGEENGSASIWFRCPHMPNFVQLNVHGGTFYVVKYDPITVKPAIKRDECGCHGKIDRGIWFPITGEHS